MDGKGDAMEIQPYLFFEGRCEEAVELYRRALDAEVEMMMRYEESPEPPPPGAVPPGSEKKIMHVSLRIGGALLMASDGSCSGRPSFGGFSLSLTVPDAATADRYFAALAEGGEVRMPLGETFWSPRFGMVADRFGVGWMITLPLKAT
jgi:PhnB protein